MGAESLAERALVFEVLEQEQVALEALTISYLARFCSSVDFYLEIHDFAVRILSKLLEWLSKIIILALLSFSHLKVKRLSYEI